jgi:tetratricopeptide (TPR) repeat protein
VSRNTGRHWAVYTLLVFLRAGMAQPQTAASLKIELKSENPILSGYSCQLDQSATHQRFASEDLRADGVCPFREVPFGDYRLSVLDSHGGAVYEDVITVGQYGPPIIIQLPKSQQIRPPSGPVSVSELQHPPARKAYAAMLSAQRFSDSGDYRHAAEQLQKAISVSPDYADAHWNLAAQYIRLGDYAGSVEESRRAMQLAKPGPLQLCNLAFAQMQLKQYHDAIESARASLRLNAEYPQAHLVLGTLLAQDRGTLPEAIPHLEFAARSLPSAARILELVRKAK